MYSQSENTQAILPYHVVRSNLTPREKALWAELSLRFGQAREIFADTASLALELQCGAPTVRRAIAGMLEKGFLKFLPKKVDKRHRAYLMAWDAEDVQPLVISKLYVTPTKPVVQSESESGTLDPGLRRDDKFSTKAGAQDESESGTLDPGLREDDQVHIEPDDWEKSPEHHSETKQALMFEQGGPLLKSQLSCWQALKITKFNFDRDELFELIRYYGPAACKYQYKHALKLEAARLMVTIATFKFLLKERAIMLPKLRNKDDVPTLAEVEGYEYLDKAREMLFERKFSDAYETAAKGVQILKTDESRHFKAYIAEEWALILDEEHAKAKRQAAIPAAV